MTDNNKIYFDTLLEALTDLSDKRYQDNVWTNSGDMTGLSISFTEAACNVYDDALVTYALENNQIIVDKKVTQALRDLGDMIDAVDEFRSARAIIDDPLMEIVRQKSSEILRLIKVSDGKENTVRLIKRGEK